MSFELSILAAFAAMFCWGIGDFLIQKVTRKTGNIETLAFIGLIGSLGLFPFVLGDLPLLFSTSNLVFLSFVGLMIFVFAVIDFEALKKGKLSVVEVILTVELPITVIFGFLFFKETLSTLQLVMILLVFVGIILIATRSFFKSNPFKSLEKGVLIALAAAIGTALINFLTAFGSKQISPLLIIWFPWVVFTIISLVLIWRREGFQTLFKNAKQFKKPIIAMGLIDTAAWVFYATALLKNKLAVTTAITESYVAIALILGVLVNKEKILAYQYIGAAIALTASIMLAFLI